MAAAAADRPEPVRQPYNIIVQMCPFGIRWNVTVEPAASERGGMDFGSHGQALALAENLSRVTGWPIKDRSE